MSSARGYRRMIKFEFSRSMSESQKLTEVVEILKHLKFQDSAAYTQFCEMVDLAQVIIEFEEKEHTKDEEIL